MSARPEDFACTCQEPHYVYRCYDSDDRLIYIGVARDVRSRLANHKAGRGNRAVAEAARMETEQYPTRAHALAAEADAIYNEAPLLNVRHNAKRIAGAGQSITPTPDELRAAINTLGATA
jgi:predicted GIY-YIG superfamily endonuclease